MIRVSITIVTLTLTTNDVQSAECDVGKQIECFAAQFDGQFAGQDGALLIENINKIIQDFEMECGCQNLELVNILRNICY